MPPSSLLPLLSLLLASAAALYVSDDAPAFGYVAADGAAHRMPAHKKYYIGGGTQKNKKLVNERAVDAYFRVLRRPAPRRARSQPRPPYALFYRSGPGPEAGDTPRAAPAYHRGGASSHVDIHSGRRAAKTIGAAGDSINRFNSL